MPTLNAPTLLDKGAYVYLVDISHFETSVDFHALAAAGISGVIAKATDGLTMVDPRYDEFRQKAAIVAKETGKFFFGSYHFFRPNLDPIVQARFYLKHATPKSGDILPCIDSETDGLSVGLRSRTFAQQVHKMVNRWPILYSGDAFYRDNLKAAFGSACPLWIARYGSQPVTPCAIWQCSESVRLAGQPRALDVDVYAGSWSDFKSKMLLK